MNGKRPTRRQKQLLKKAGLNYDNWLIEKAPPGELHLKHKDTGQRRILRVVA